MIIVDKTQSDGSPAPREWITVPLDAGVHIVPSWGPDHEADDQCWCWPKVEEEPESLPIVIHNEPAN